MDSVATELPRRPRCIVICEFPRLVLVFIRPLRKIRYCHARGFVHNNHGWAYPNRVFEYTRCDGGRQREEDNDGRLFDVLGVRMVECETFRQGASKGIRSEEYRPFPPFLGTKAFCGRRTLVSLLIPSVFF